MYFEVAQYNDSSGTPPIVDEMVSNGGGVGSWGHAGLRGEVIGKTTTSRMGKKDDVFKTYWLV